mmetsp:Transcript_40253/g.84242  ORF Transcript_40253/g.84242 Transcript_40253/m.84242 type:complete len:351 (-) Transcript_40253:318-1370(-)
MGLHLCQIPLQTLVLAKRILERFDGFGVLSFEFLTEFSFAFDFRQEFRFGVIGRIVTHEGTRGADGLLDVAEEEFGFGEVGVRGEFLGAGEAVLSMEGEELRVVLVVVVVVVVGFGIVFGRGGLLRERIILLRWWRFVVAISPCDATRRRRLRLLLPWNPRRNTGVIPERRPLDLSAQFARRTGSADVAIVVPRILPGEVAAVADVAAAPRSRTVVVADIVAIIVAIIVAETTVVRVVATALGNDALRKNDPVAVAFFPRDGDDGGAAPVGGGAGGSGSTGGLGKVDALQDGIGTIGHGTTRHRRGGCRRRCGVGRSRGRRCSRPGGSRYGTVGRWFGGAVRRTLFRGVR